MSKSRFVILALAATMAIFLVTSAHANIWVGDLVYCDTDFDGRYEPADGDFPLDGVTVNMVCEVPDGVCFDSSTTTGTLHSSVPTTSNFSGNCPTADWDPNNGPAPGRYLFDIYTACVDIPANDPANFPNFDYGPTLYPTTCTITVDESTLPSDCDGLVTPKTTENIPNDGNGDGDLCDPEDGPFPEDQRSNDEDPAKACDPNPGNGVFTTRYDYFSVDCLPHNDFGYGFDGGGGGPTRTPGFWKNHPSATSQFLPLDFCGVTVTTHCEAYEFLSDGGGGLSKFHRHGMAALLNCTAEGCPSAIADLVAEGSAACAAGDMTFDYGTAGTELDVFNNSGVDLDVSFNHDKADPKACKNK